MRSGYITIDTSEDGPMEAYHVHPESVGPHPALVVIPEAFGLTSWVRNTCHHLASEGYVALAPDIYHRFGNRIEVDYTDMQSAMGYLAKLTNEGLLHDVRHSLERLRNVDYVRKDKLGVVGFCVGGFGTYLAACNTDAQAYVVFYGGGIVNGREGIGIHPILDETSGIQAPILLFFGAEDKSIPQTDVKLIDETLTKFQKKHDIKVYPDAGHGFMCDDRSSFRPNDAGDAYRRTLAFFNHHLDLVSR